MWVFRLIYFTNVLPAYMYVYHIHSSCSQRSEKGVGSHGTAIMGGHEWPCGCWELRFSERAASAQSPEPTLQLVKMCFKGDYYEHNGDTPTVLDPFQRQLTPAD